MEHAFLTREGVWTAEGTYFDASGKAYPAKGRMRVVHGRGVWALQSVLTVERPDGPQEVANRYDVTPLAPGAVLAPWISINPGMGLLRGLVFFVDDAIFSEFDAADGVARGWECMVLRPDGAYLDRGAILRGGEVSSAWSLTVRSWEETAR